MPSSKAPIEVPEALARAYREASPEQKERAERAMAYALLSRSEVAREFRRITERAIKRPSRDKYKIRPAMTADTLLGMGFHVVQGQVQATGFRPHPSDFV